MPISIIMCEEFFVDIWDGWKLDEINHIKMYNNRFNWCLAWIYILVSMLLHYCFA
jgi:hypothetical protein